MRPTTTLRHRRLLAALACAALVATACGNDSTTTGPADTADTADTVDTADTTPPPTEPPGDTADDAADDTAEPAPLTATDTGVTESTIRVGAVFPDTSLIGRDPGDLEAKFRTIADAVNAAGGINGRTIDLIFRPTNPLDDASYDRVCVELTEDEEVFAAIGLFVRTTADCYPALHDTIVISTFGISQDQMDTYTAPGITTMAHPLRLVNDRVAALIDAGVLTPGEKLAVTGSEQDDAAHEAYVDALEAAGIEVVANTVGTATGEDLLALQSEQKTFTQVWQSSGAEAVLATTSLVSQAVLIAYNNADISLPIILPEGTGVAPSLLQSQLGLDLSPFELATALVGGDDQATKYETGADGVRECVDAFEAASGETVALDESRNNLAPTIVACQVFDVFTQVAEAAGPELTTESFAAAVDSFGPIEVTDLAAASLGPGKWDLDDSVGVPARFNPDTVQFEPVD